MNWDKLRREFFETFADINQFKSGVGTMAKPIHVFHWFKDKLTVVKRTNAQNAAIHLYMTKWANSLNNTGYTFTNALGLEIPFTMELIKESIWKPTQKELFGIKSTTKLTTEMINKMIDVFSLNFGEKGIYVEFPSWQSFLNEQDADNYS